MPPPAEPDEDDGGGDGDAASGCGRQLDPGDEIEDTLHAIVDDMYLYVLDAAPVPGAADFEFRLWRYHRERGGAELLAVSEPREGDATAFTTQLSMDDESLYVSWDGLGDNGLLLRISRDGGSVDTISGDAINSLAVDESHVYWSTDYVSGQYQPTIKRRAKSGDEEEILIQDGVDGRLPSAEIAVAGDHLLWNDVFDGNLRRIPKAGGAPEVVGALVPDGAPLVQAFRVAGDGLLYWSHIAGRRLRLFRSPPDPFALEHIVTQTGVLGGSNTDLFVVEGYLYWQSHPVDLDSSEPGGIWRAPADGREPATAVYLDARMGAWVPSSAGMYVADGVAGVRVIPLEGCPD